MGDRQPSLKLYAVGDITLGDHPMCVGFGTHSRLSGRPGLDPLDHVRSLLAPADVLFGSLECALSADGLDPRDYHSVQMRGRPDYAAYLSRAGFSIVNLATNHTQQHGPGPFLDTIETLDGHGIARCGVGRAESREAEPSILEVRGCRVAFLGYSLRPRQYFSDPPLYTEGDVTRPEVAARAVSAARERADFVAVSLHWGDEFVPRPSPEEIRFARALVDAGAGLVLGHHPHVLRGVERYGDGVIAYSLGNFVCDMSWNDALREAVVLRCTLGEGKVLEHDCVPTVLNGDYQPVPARDGDARRIQSRLAGLSEALESDELNDFENRTAGYREEALSYEARLRAMSQRFFLRNLHRYPFSMMRQHLASFARNRCRELADRFGRRR